MYRNWTVQKSTAPCPEVVMYRSGPTPFILSSIYTQLAVHTATLYGGMTEVTTDTTDTTDRNDRPVAVSGISNYASETKFYPNNVHILFSFILDLQL